MAVIPECEKCGHSAISHRNGWDCRALVNYGGGDEVCDCAHLQDGADEWLPNDSMPVEVFHSMTRETLEILDRNFKFTRVA